MSCFLEKNFPVLHSLPCTRMSVGVMIFAIWQWKRTQHQEQNMPNSPPTNLLSLCHPWSRHRRLKHRPALVCISQISYSLSNTGLHRFSFSWIHDDLLIIIIILLLWLLLIYWLWIYDETLKSLLQLHLTEHLKNWWQDSKSRNYPCN